MDPIQFGMCEQCESVVDVYDDCNRNVFSEKNNRQLNKVCDDWSFSNILLYMLVFLLRASTIGQCDNDVIRYEWITISMFFNVIEHAMLWNKSIIIIIDVSNMYSYYICIIGTYCGWLSGILYIHSSLKFSRLNA